MGRKAKPKTIDEAIERLQVKAVEAASKAKPTGKASKQLLDITHHLTCLQLIKAMTDGENVAGSAGLDLPYGDDGSDIEDFNILEDNSK